METNKLSITQALKFTFVTFIEHFPFFLKAILAATGTYLAFLIILSSLGSLLFWHQIASFVQLSRALGCLKVDQLSIFIINAGPAFWIVWGIILFLAIAAWRFFLLGFTHAGFMFYDHKIPTVKDVFSQSHKVLRDTTTFLIFLCMSAIGFMFFCLPGIYIFILLGFFHQSIVYHNSSILSSLRESKKLVHSNWWKICAIYILYWIISHALKIFLWFLTMPLGSLLNVYVYRKLLESHVDESIAAA